MFILLEPKYWCIEVNIHKFTYQQNIQNVCYPPNKSINNGNLGNYHLYLLTSDYTNITQKNRYLSNGYPNIVFYSEQNKKSIGFTTMYYYLFV